MSDRIFFDTNVLVYCYTETEPNKKSVAVEFAQSPDAWISTQVLQELSNTLRRKFGKEWTEVVGTLEEVCQNFEIFTNLSDTLRDAIRIADKYGYSLYDSLILSSALAVGCKIVYSEDMQNGQVIDGGLTIVNPFLS
jgi:predicted nucleic acid-binding protein